MQLAAASGPDGEIVGIAGFLYDDLAEHDAVTTDLDHQFRQRLICGAFMFEHPPVEFTDDGTENNFT